MKIPKKLFPVAFQRDFPTSNEMKQLRACNLGGCSSNFGWVAGSPEIVRGFFSLPR
jgi:hypothetical protein